MSSQPISVPPKTRFLPWEEESALQEQSLVFACKQHIDQYGWSADFARLYGHMPELRGYDPQDPPEFCHGVTAAQQRFVKSHNEPLGIRPPREQLANNANSNAILKQHTITKKDKPCAIKPRLHVNEAIPQCEDGNKFNQKGKKSICHKLKNDTEVTPEQLGVSACLQRATAYQAQENIRHDRVAGPSKKPEVRFLARENGSGSRKYENRKPSDDQADDFATESDYDSDDGTEGNLGKLLPDLSGRHDDHTTESCVPLAADLRLGVEHVKDRQANRNLATRNLPNMRNNSPTNNEPRKRPTGTGKPSIPQPVFRPNLGSKLYIRQQLKRQDLATSTSKLKLRELVQHARKATAIQGYHYDQDYHDSETIDVEVDLWNLKI